MPTHKKSVSINDEDVRKAEEKFQNNASKVAEEAAREAAAAEQKKRKDKEAKFKESWKVPPRYEVRKLLGSGAYGNVCEAKDREENRRVAIKQCRHLLDDVIDAKRILREIAILSKLDHKHVVGLHDVILTHDIVRFNELYMVLEICDSDLKKLCRADVNLDNLHVTSLLYNLLVGLNYLHSAGIWHRDLKPANCLVNEDCCVKICDFGLARAVGESHFMNTEEEKHLGEKRHLTGHVVTRWYRAPELILLQDNYTEAIDIWSVGCIYAELLGMLEGTKFEDRAPLFPGHTCFPLSPHEAHKTDTKYYTKGTRDQLCMICNLIGTPSEEDIQQIVGSDAQMYMRCFAKRDGTGVQKKFSSLERDGSKLLEQMLVFNPSKRITVTQALEHDLFESVRDRKLETTAATPMSLDFEKEEELDEQELRALFLQEVRKYHPKVPSV